METSSRRKPGTRRRPEQPAVDELGIVRCVLLRAGAVAVLGGLSVLGLTELTELRGELAFARFYSMEQLAEKSRTPDHLARTVRNASSEATLVILFASRNPEALWEIATSCLRWVGREELDPVLRLRLAEKAVQAAMLAVSAAPSDYDNWLWLACAHAVLGLWEQADICLNRARDLAPPGLELELLETGLDAQGSHSQPGRSVQPKDGATGIRLIRTRSRQEGYAALAARSIQLPLAVRVHPPCAHGPRSCKENAL